MNPAPSTPRVLLLPGWQNSGPGHWQSRWEAAHGDVRVQQHDWLWPRRGDWMAQLESAVRDSPHPVLLAAHSLGCHLVAAWAAHSQQIRQQIRPQTSPQTTHVMGALLVAPPDLLQAGLPPQLKPWSPPIRQRLPFPSVLVYSDNDPFATAEASRSLAADWGASTIAAGAAGHLNAESGMGDWPQGRQWLLTPASGESNTGVHSR